ncbi:MAG: TonB-dependent receptor [Methylophaga sp.]|nr:TonB-dependent receptor [Methylophaga sp.]
MKKRKVALGGLLLCITSVSLAMEDSFFSTDLPVVISASRLTQSVLTSPSAVTIIDKAMIEASGFVEIADLMRLVPGFQVAYADGKDIAVTYHGQGWEYPNRLQLLVNGRSTYTSALSTVDWSAVGVHITDIDRIEVVRGPAAPAYGSNSFSAAINIITISPELDDKFMVRVRSGNKEEQETLLRYSDSVGDMHYRVSAATRENSGFDDANDFQDLNSLSVQGRMELKNHDVLDINLAYTNGETGTDFEEFLPTHDRSLTALSGHVQWQRQLSDHEDLKLNFYHNYHDEDDAVDSFLLSEVLGISPALFTLATGAPDQTTTIGLRTNRSTRTDLELQYNWVNDTGLKFVAGTGIRYDTLKSDFSTHFKGTISDTSYRFYGNMQLPLFDKLTANIGASYEAGRTNEAHLSPRLSLNWRVSEEQSFRVAVSRAYRLNSLLETNLDTRTELSNGVILDIINYSDDDLEAEEITSFELGYLGKLSAFPFSWEFKAYREQIDKVTAFVGDRGVVDLVNNKARVLLNAGYYKTYGIEGEITYRPQQDLFVKFQFNHGYSDEKTLKRINTTRIFRSNDRAPKESYGLLATLPIHDWHFNLGVYRVGAIEWKGQGDYVEAYTRVDASVSKDFKFGSKRKVKLKIAAQNINNKYEEFKEDQFSKPFYYAEISFTEF